jgi:hypothetical protein
MDDNRRDELDVVLEGALREWASGAVAPERVWTSIDRTLQERSGRRSASSRRLRHMWTDACYVGADVFTFLRIVLAPSLRGAESGWTERLVLAGQSQSACRLSFNH